MHCVVRYALWARRAGSQGPEHTGNQQDWMSQVKEVLELHLEPAKDPSLAIRAVYGQWFPWLASIDNEWARHVASRVFSPDEADLVYWDAAWNTYLAMCPAYDDVADMLISQYSLAVDRLRPPATLDRPSLRRDSHNIS